MAYVQVNNASHTLKLAAFIVAFFSSFFSYSADIDYSSLSGEPAVPKLGTTVMCGLSIKPSIGQLEMPVINTTLIQRVTACKNIIQDYIVTMPAYNACSAPSVTWKTISSGVPYPYIAYTHSSGPAFYQQCDFTAHSSGQASASILNEFIIYSCPPPLSPSYTFEVDSNDDGDIDTCYKPADVQALQDAQREDEKADEYCQNYVLDSGNNTANNMCYSSSNGSSCNVQKVTTDGGGSYYKGVSSSDGGCATSENPPYDDAGTGEGKDDCLYSGGVNYCQANRDKHCSTTVGVEICDDGCIDDGTNLFCDTSKHPDVGEGDSNYFDDNGTCSVISASSSRGFCEDNDGTWDETTDYQETSCPAGAGTCSVAVAGLCGSCFDAGGTWTPDPTALLSDEAKVGIENGALAKTGNDKLSQIEHGQRKTSEATQSTIKSGTGKIVNAIESLGEKLGQSKAEEEKESFTTTTSTIEKSKINSLFDAAATATLTADIETLKTDITTSINSIRAEASSMMSITVPNSTGYEARNLTLTQGTFDVSLSRFGEFFRMLATPIMLVCSILAGLILLGGKN
ncbi:hypothetical protein A9Q75_05185 [Colwellia psychrerythraea]|uniref:Uncharacterized protein n=1 Tax=Colwellia psychrerythraea TaxID=28229 RepID=A0A1Y5EPA3_COLPS|nr:hypothetical protein A9Q75_05185 [Colwellia psychrerythraea]